MHINIKNKINIYEVRNLKRHYNLKERKAIKKFKRTRFHRCYYCHKIIVDKQEVTCDHYIAYSSGGKTNKSNFRIACHSCNQKKSNMNPKHFLSLQRKSNTRKLKEFMSENKRTKISKLIHDSDSLEDKLFIAKSDSRYLSVRVMNEKWADLPRDSMMDIFKQIES
jgi:5-methylcytosine-specific restriction endonuclease McrA